MCSNKYILRFEHDRRHHINPIRCWVLWSQYWSYRIFMFGQSYFIFQKSRFNLRRPEKFSVGYEWIYHVVLYHWTLWWWRSRLLFYWYARKKCIDCPESCYYFTGKYRKKFERRGFLKVIAAILLSCNFALKLWRKHLIPKVTNQITNTEIRTEVRFYQTSTFRMIMLNSIILLNGICGLVSAYYKVSLDFYIFFAWLGFSLIIGACSTCVACCAATDSDLSRKCKSFRIHFTD